MVTGALGDQREGHRERCAAEQTEHRRPQQDRVGRDHEPDGARDAQQRDERGHPALDAAAQRCGQGERVAGARAWRVGSGGVRQRT